MSSDILIDDEHPWPGLESYGEYAQFWFHGRKQETEALLALVRRETLTILYGRSGLGKTSLLQAGLFPMLRREGFLPIRINLQFEDGSPDFIEQIGEAIRLECRESAVESPIFLKKITLWEYFYSRDCDFWSADDQLLVPVLVFDQFEEIFTLGRESPVRQNRCESLLIELGDLIENRQPQVIRAMMATDDKISAKFDVRRSGPRVLLSFREDYLPDFNILYNYVRARTSNQLRLLPMDGLTAKNAIETVASGRVSSVVAEKIIRFIDPKKHPLDFLQIEPALMSLVCCELNHKRIALKKVEISADLIQGNITWHIIEYFYRECFVGLDIRVKHFVEDRLLTKAGYRDSYALDNALSEPGVSKSALQALVDRRLLRREDRGGLVRLELIHDILTEVAKSSRDKRRDAAALDRAKRQVAKQKRRQRWMAIATLCLILILASISWLAWDALQSRQVAYEQRQIAENARAESDHNFALALAEKAERAFSEQRFNDGHIYAAHALTRLDVSKDQDLRADLIGDRLSNSGNQLISTLSGHEKEVWGIAFSPDAKLLASAGSDKTVKVWDINSGKVVKELRGHEKEVLGLAFSTDGKLLASGSIDKTVRIWSMADGSVITTLHGHRDRVWSVAFAPDGKTLASGSADQTVIIWDITGGKPVATLRGHEKEVRSVVFLPDGKKLASGSLDSTIKLWDLSGSKGITELSTMREHEKDVFAIAISSDGKTLASGSSDKTIKIWDLDKGRVVDTLRGNENSILSVAFSLNNSRILASGGSDKIIKIWDLDNSSKPLATLRGHDNAIRGVVFSPDHSMLASAGLDSTIKIWSWTPEMTPTIFRGHKKQVVSVAFSPDGKKLATGSFDKTIKIWDVASGETITTLQGHDNEVLSVAFSPDGKKLASGSFDRSLVVWDLSTKRSIFALRDNPNSVLSVAFSSTGDILASGCDKNINLYNASNGNLINVLRGHEKSVASVAFSPDGKMLASGSKDYAIKLWDLASGATIATLGSHDKEVASVAFSPDGKMLASGSTDKTIKLWNIDSGKTFATLLGHEASVFGVAFSPDGKYLASGSYDKSIKLWDTASGSVVATLHGSQDTVRSVAFSVNGLLASGGEDKTVKIWAISNDQFANTDWRAKAIKDEKLYGLKLDGITLVPFSQSFTGKSSD